MPKVTGPFMSINASGTIGKLLTAKKIDSTCTIRKKAGPRATNSTTQLIEQGRMRAARAAFKALSTSDANLWKWVAEKRRVSRWAAFWAEYQHQRVAAPSAPLIPSTWV